MCADTLHHCGSPRVRAHGNKAGTHAGLKQFAVPVLMRSPHDVLGFVPAIISVTDAFTSWKACQ